MLKRGYAAVVAVVVAAVLLLAGAAIGGSLDLQDGMMGRTPPPFRGIEETIWFQGYVADSGGGEPVSATYTVTARIYDSEVGGASVWGLETHVATVITDGWFNIELGSVIGGLPAFDTPPYYLQLTINSELLAPRLKLASVPSAFQSLGADNGLNLPYSGTYGTSGNVFHITNTGPNICGYFVINNAGSTASSLYGAHNGPGAAVMAWHDGTGPALRAVANGPGYAGTFDGPVTVSDSMRVEGKLRTSGDATVNGNLYAVEGFQFESNPVEGYVLRCTDQWGNAEWAPPNVIDTHNENASTIVTGSVTQNDNAEVTLTVPGPGYIVVTSNVWFKFDHTMGTTDGLYLAHSTSPTVMPTFYYDRVYWEVPSDTATNAQLDRTLAVNSTHMIMSAGTYTYYLVGQMYAGADGGDNFWYSQTTGIYYPYPTSVRSDEADDAGVVKKNVEFESQ